MSKIDKFSKDELQELVNNSNSLGDVLKQIGLKPAGGNYKTLDKIIAKYSIDLNNMLENKYTLFAEQAMKLGKCNQIPLSEILQKESNYPSDKLKRRLIKEGIFENVCSCCGLTEWMGKPLTIHLHHINGDKTDNRLENLKILCPNCHSQTDNYTGKNLKLRNRVIKKYDTKRCSKVSKFCNACGVKLSHSTKGVLCAKCSKLKQRKVERPSTEVLLQDIKELGYCGTGRKYGVSDNAIRKWINEYKK